MSSTGGRFDRLDALRGVAIVWMAIFHFCFDLNHFGFFEPKHRFTVDVFWTTQRTMIVSLFLFCAGLAQAVAVEQRQSWSRFWKRWAQIAGCAVLVSIGSYWMFPKSWIFFGVLHGIAVLLIGIRLLAPLGRWRRYDAGRQGKMKQQLERILAAPKLSGDVYEIASKSLA